MINRFIINVLRKEIHQPEIKILLGPRQAGKTTLLRMLDEEFKKEGMKTSFFDLEEPRILAEFNGSPQEIIDKLKKAGQVCFIDEFQYIPNASKILKAVHDSRSPMRIFCSGSSSLEIHKHLKESLAGRRILFRIFPLQYSEVLASNAGFSLDDYLMFGGMPAVAVTPDKTRKQTLLSELLSAYILKDVKSLLKEENIRAFNHFLYLLAQHQGSVLSLHSLSRDVGLSSKALGRYLDIMEATFVNFRVPSFSSNLGNELKKSFKTYLYDPGMRNAILKDFSDLNDRKDQGAIFESFVFLKLKTLEAPDSEIRFWRTKSGEEVDFIFLHTCLNYK